MPGVYILLSPQEKEIHSSFWVQTCTHSATHSSKRFKPLSAIIFLCQGYCWIGKNTSKEFNCVMLMVLIIRPSGALNLDFLFGFNECLWSFPYQFLKLSGFVFGLWLSDFWFYDTDDFKSPPMPMNKKFVSAKTTKYILGCWERSVKRNSNLNFILVIKNSSFDQHFLLNI